MKYSAHLATSSRLQDMERYSRVNLNFRNMHSAAHLPLLHLMPVFTAPLTPPDTFSHFHVCIFTFSFYSQNNIEVMAYYSFQWQDILKNVLKPFADGLCTVDYTVPLLGGNVSSAMRCCGFMPALFCGAGFALEKCCLRICLWLCYLSKGHKNEGWEGKPYPFPPSFPDSWIK